MRWCDLAYHPTWKQILPYLCQGAVVIGFLDTMLGAPSNVVLIGDNAAGHSRPVIAAPADKHKPGLAGLYKDREQV